MFTWNVFHRSNFLKLHIFYASLEKETAEQVPAYDNMDFLGITAGKIGSIHKNI